MIKKNDSFDFEKWAKLASKDPEAFEQHREKLINEFITELPEDRQQRMRCIQWRVDSVRRLAKTPMAACIEISRMMWDSVKGENGLLEALQNLTKTCRFDTPISRPNPINADILSFPGEFSKPKSDNTTYEHI